VEINEMPKYAVADLRLAATTVAMAEQDVCDRYDGFITPIDGPAVPGLTFLANIEVEQAKVGALMASHDVSLSEKAMLADLTAKTNVFGTITVDDANHIGIIAFRGTRTVPEWFDDIALSAPVRFEEVDHGTWVHKGFHLIYMTIRDNMLHQLELLKDYDRVIITGHSLGAAVASLCLLELRGRSDGAKYEGMTFASPGTFFGKPRKFVESGAKSLRIFNPGDIVPRFPSVVYWHVPGGIKIKTVLNPKTFHSLKETYIPGTEELYAQRSAAGQPPDFEVEGDHPVPLLILEEDIAKAKAAGAEADVEVEPAVIV